MEVGQQQENQHVVELVKNNVLAVNVVENKHKLYLKIQANMFGREKEIKKHVNFVEQVEQYKLS